MLSFATAMVHLQTASTTAPAARCQSRPSRPPRRSSAACAQSTARLASSPCYGIRARQKAPLRTCPLLEHLVLNLRLLCMLSMISCCSAVLFCCAPTQLRWPPPARRQRVVRRLHKLCCQPHDETMKETSCKMNQLQMSGPIIIYSCILGRGFVYQSQMFRNFESMDQSSCVQSCRRKRNL